VTTAARHDVDDVHLVTKLPSWSPSSESEETSRRQEGREREGMVSPDDRLAGWGWQNTNNPSFDFIQTTYLSLMICANCTRNVT
jgi:hypothetical protein